jgi:hypothetical protein
MQQQKQYRNKMMKPQANTFSKYCEDIKKFDISTHILYKIQTTVAKKMHTL